MQPREIRINLLLLGVQIEEHRFLAGDAVPTPLFPAPIRQRDLLPDGDRKDEIQRMVRRSQAPPRLLPGFG